MVGPKRPDANVCWCLSYRLMSSKENRALVGPARGERVRQLVQETPPPGVLAYVWVHRFPMFKWDAEGQRWDATHNPFSGYFAEDEGLLESDPGAVRAKQYDLVGNGNELGGGSIRIPASASGVFGLKPSFGRIPRTGDGFSGSLNVVGPIGASTRELALYLTPAVGEADAAEHGVRRAASRRGVQRREARVRRADDAGRHPPSAETHRRTIRRYPGDRNGSIQPVYFLQR